MAEQHREVEDKYDLAPDAALPALAALPGVVAVAEPVEQHLVATYVDTADLRLAAAGMTLRRRTGGDDAGWHLKLPAGGARHEVREPLGRSKKAVPRRLRATVTTLVRDQDLVPVAEIETRRTAHRLLDADGRVLAEVADDQVTARTKVGERSEQQWREVEVELVDGDESLLAAAAELLEGVGARKADLPSKLRRALGDRVPGPRTVAPRSPDDAAAALVQHRLAELVDAVVGSDPLVREDLPDGVHSMRVAVRRLRSALATYRPFLGREVTEPLRDELRWLGGVLGEARDAEVQRERLAGRIAEVAENEPGTVTGVDEARVRIDRHLEEEYAAAHQRCLDALGSARYLSLLDRLVVLVDRPPWTDKAHEPIGDVVVRRLRHERRRVTHRVEAIEEADPAHGLHEARKAAKRLRYAVEPLVEIYGDDTAAVVEDLKALQDLLGEHQDTVTARARLTGLAEHAAAARENSLVYGLLHARETDVAEQIEADFADAWPALAKKVRKRLP